MLIPGSDWLSLFSMLSMLSRDTLSSNVSFSLSVIKRKESPYTDFLFSNIFWFINSEIMLSILSLSIFDASIFFKYF